MYYAEKIKKRIFSNVRGLREENQVLEDKRRGIHDTYVKEKTFYISCNGIKPPANFGNPS
jgi:hypothetical protein